MILDSNILIYLVQPEYSSLRLYLAQRKDTPFVSLITKLEVLGFHRLRSDHNLELERLLAAAFMLPISEEIITEAIRLLLLRPFSIKSLSSLITVLILKTSPD
ncbi:hypothetical protein WBJ53_20230 [Spirosoma sp. SC4-14]|uniref:hypothetical protein n=1 Tax=Spirosoma sp. SC4-14 TaxID=3128900 RepID=UPI0030D17C9A